MGNKLAISRCNGIWETTLHTAPTCYGLASGKLVQCILALARTSRSLSGMAPAYLAADCQLSSEIKKVVVSCVLPTQGPVSSGRPTATLGTGVSRLPYRPKAVEEPFQALDKRTSAMSSFKCLLKT